MSEPLSAGEMERYRRQLMLNGFTKEHQARLKRSTALVAGVGGLGGTAALYLAVAGIGKLVLVHSGKLTVSNMNRQILMRDSGIGESRVILAREAIGRINPYIAVETFDERFTIPLAGRLLAGADIAISSRPNFSERRALNEACIGSKKPMVEAAMNGMEGYLFNVIPEKTPCLNCVYPEDPPGWEELGFPVLGAVPGMLGCLMALEAIKILTGFAGHMTSQMLVFNLTDMDFRKVRLRRDSACGICGPLKT